MVESVTIERFRGIKEGKLEGLKPLTILTGMNASGKSAVLDALLIGASREIGQSIWLAIRRHPATWDGGRWLVHGARDGVIASIDLGLGSGEHYQTQMSWASAVAGGGRLTVTVQFEGRGAVQHSAEIKVDNTCKFSGMFDMRRPFPYVKVIDPGTPFELHAEYSLAYRQGRAEELNAMVRELVPSALALAILTEADGAATLNVQVVGGAVPVTLSGDGVQSLIQLAVQLAAQPDGLALIEEPEAFQHPAALHQTARAIVAAVRRGVQVVLTTHSMELIDKLIDEVRQDEVDQMALFTLVLEGGVLKKSRSSGDDMVFARRHLNEDLR